MEVGTVDSAVATDSYEDVQSVIESTELFSYTHENGLAVSATIEDMGRCAVLGSLPPEVRAQIARAHIIGQELQAKEEKKEENEIEEVKDETEMEEKPVTREPRADNKESQASDSLREQIVIKTASIQEAAKENPQPDKSNEGADISASSLVTVAEAISAPTKPTHAASKVRSESTNINKVSNTPSKQSEVIKNISTVDSVIAEASLPREVQTATAKDVKPAIQKLKIAESDSKPQSVSKKSDAAEVTSEEYPNQEIQELSAEKTVRTVSEIEGFVSTEKIEEGNRDNLSGVEGDKSFTLAEGLDNEHQESVIEADETKVPEPIVEDEFGVDGIEEEVWPLPEEFEVGGMKTHEDYFSVPESVQIIPSPEYRAEDTSLINILPELSLPVEAVEQTALLVAERVEELDDESAELVHQIFEEIIEKVDEVQSIVKKAAVESDTTLKVEAIEEELKELFIQIFDQLEIEYTPELVEGFLVVALRDNLSELIQTDDEEIIVIEKTGTHEIIRRILSGVSNIKKLISRAYLLGKSAIRLYDFEYSVLQTI